MKKISLKKIITKILIISNLFVSGFENKPIFSNESNTTIDSNYLNRIPQISNYILGPGDNLDIKISEEVPSLDRTVTVDGEGTIFLPRLKRIYVQNLTVSELISLLNKDYKNYLYEPNVEISIIEYRPIKILVKGEVEEPGLKILQYKKLDQNEDNVIFPTIYDAVRESNGVSVFADLENVEITRINTLSNGGGRIKTEINLLEMLDLNDFNNNFRLFDGDTIFIPRSVNPNTKTISKAIKSTINPKFISVLIAGRVENPGSLKVNKSTTLVDAIDISGGAKILKGKVKFIRYKNNGDIEKRTFALRKNSPNGSYKNPYLKNGDIIVVGKSALNVTNEVLNEFTTPIRGLLSSYSLYKIITE